MTRVLSILCLLALGACGAQKPSADPSEEPTGDDAVDDGDVSDDATGPARLILSDVEGALTEAGDSATFSISLSKAPTQPVVLTLAVSDDEEAIVNLPEITFAPEKGDEVFEVIVQGLEDRVIDGDKEISLTISVESEDEDYKGLADTRINLRNQDIDVGGLVFTRSKTTVTAGEDTLFEVRLASRPTSGNYVTAVPVAIDARCEIHMSGSIYWPIASWDAARTVPIGVGVDYATTPGFPGVQGECLIGFYVTSDDANFDTGTEAAHILMFTRL